MEQLRLVKPIIEYKAIIVDLDCTLLRTDKSISEYTLQVLKKCREKGILIMAATARPERSILIYHELVQFDAMTVMNGADVILLGKKSQGHEITKESAEVILQRLCVLPDIILSLEMGNDVYVNIETLIMHDCRNYVIRGMMIIFTEITRLVDKDT